MFFRLPFRANVLMNSVSSLTALRPGALPGADYQLEYYEDGYPKLPACLDRRRKPASLAEAA